MPPMTRGMAHKGIRHYALYNLHSRGPNQMLLDLSTLLSTPRTLTCLHNNVGARGVVPTPHIHVAKGNPPGNTVTVGFAVKTRFIQDCLELVKAIGEEQKKMQVFLCIIMIPGPTDVPDSLWALEADEIILQERLEMFGEHTTGYINNLHEVLLFTCQHIVAFGLWIAEVLDDKVLEWLWRRIQ
ncbi:hypothetical protein EV401DRAFT_1886536 [Pisolithus croceorrhizus]|nr:hypothetical protein EV401DRAFT_1886536 [Pisolithus croceorrhizus]